ncbi:MAG: hypothetical protein KDC92_03710 [Bacteroidetes bacterium]|nr:hypothetical protein [Bacteroidota bacterium]
MKTKFTLLLGVICTIASNAQTWTKSIPDIYNQPASTSYHFLSNEGQVINTDGNAEPNIKVETRGEYADVYYFNDKISTAVPIYEMVDYVDEIDYFIRYDLHFHGANYSSGTPTLHEATGINYNFYLPQTDPGAENVMAHSRLIYDDIYPGIDLNFYSSVTGPKMYMVVYPGGDETDIEFSLAGFNSLNVNSTSIVGSVPNYELTINQPVAYQFDQSNNTTELSWQPTFYESNGHIKMSFGTYDINEPLVLLFRDAEYSYSEKTTHGMRNLKWATYFGNSSPGMAVTPSGN